VMIGGPGTCAFIPCGVPHAWRTPAPRPATSSSLHPGEGRWVSSRSSCHRRPSPATPVSIELT
jgi:hypothetical protein